MLTEYAAVTGVMFGLFFCLVGLGLNLVFGVLRLVNLAHGDILMLGAFGAYFAYTLAAVNPLVALVAEIVPFFAFGFVLYYLLVPRVNRSRDPEMVSLIMFFGVSQALEAIAFLVFGNSERSLSGPIFGAAPVSLLGQDYPVSYVVSALAMSRRLEDPAGVLRDAIDVAHEQVDRGIAQDAAREGMGTTFTAVLAGAGRFALAHVGDSRAYLLREGRLSQLTHDHTFVQALLDEGRISREEAARHPYRSMVLQVVDGRHRPEPDLVPLDLVDGDRVLVCSDGLSDLVPEQLVAEHLAVGDPQEAASALVDAALGAGGRDNVTCVVGEVVAAPEVRPEGMLLGALADVQLVVDPAAVRSPDPT